MRIAIFCHSLISSWNHGNAHFLRGIVAELSGRDHDVRVYEEEANWSLRNLLRERPDDLAAFAQRFPTLKTNFYRPSELDLDAVLEDVDLVLVHEWNDYRLIGRIGSYRALHDDIRVLFHDTHHRAATLPHEMEGIDLTNYDGVLAFGEVIRTIYVDKGWARAAWTWHEAADTRLFHPLPDRVKERDLVWIGNWGDDERTEELYEFLLGPLGDLGLEATIYGVRYPADAQREVAAAGAAYAGYLPNHLVPEAFAASRLTVHVPRRPYVQALPGIPTIRVFEALACGIPLICSPWDDAEGLFEPGDYLVASNREEMTRHMKEVLNEPDLAAQLSRNGVERIRSRHTCAHRVDELLEVCKEIGAAT